MKTYTIGELFSAFNDTKYIGYIYKGDLKGRLIMCDTNNEDRLMWIKPDGIAGYDFYIGVRDISIDEARQFVFYHESDQQMKNEIINCYLDAIANELKRDQEEENID